MRRVLTAVLLVAGSMLLGVAPAEAGGPTSVLLTNPDLGRATAIYYSDPRYEELDTLLHGTGALTSEPRPPLTTEATHLNVTWLAHDVSVWRTEQVRLHPSGDAWLASDGGAWLALDNGDRISDLAASLGLTGSRGGPTTQVAPTPAAEEQLSTPPATVVREETRWFSLTGWRWAVPGLLLGLVTAGLARRRRDVGVPLRQELIDGPPERVTSPG